jgi:electron transfer flavoprotein beta subunit
MGQQGVGGDNAQIPGLVAEILDLPQVTMAVKIEVQEGKATIEREVEGAHETWETTLPAVVSAQKGLNEPRYASLKGIMAAKKKPIETKGAADLGLAPEKLAPRTKVVALELPPARSAVKMIEGDPDTQVKELLRLLHEEAKVI